MLVPGANWGHKLDAFCNILRGGFGTPEGGSILRSVNPALSRECLGHSEMVRQLGRRLKDCHPTNRSSVAAKLERAKRGIGPTVFDWLVEIIGIPVPAAGRGWTAWNSSLPDTIVVIGSYSRSRLGDDLLMATREFLNLDPKTLHLPSSRLVGADPVKLHDQTRRFGSSLDGMPPVLVYRGSDAALMIYDEATRATWAARQRPGHPIRVEVIRTLARPVGQLPLVGDLMP